MTGCLPPPWSPDEDNELRALWARGLPVNDIAARLARRNRNAVTGRALRIGLPRRPSPIPGRDALDRLQASRDAQRAKAADEAYARAIALASREQTNF